MPKEQPKVYKTCHPKKDGHRRSKISSDVIINQEIISSRILPWIACFREGDPKATSSSYYRLDGKSNFRKSIKILNNCFW